ncbi:hypothetical protein [Candidatus Palauibacter soopunensis]|uniref:hypothetical protein n=1 Tax=Candidatus Palauibacter soopunensis TaxID=3056739 RepID=UPI002383BBC1|nr:hypothetical protein [Candidatus Palauibacter soopunensis]MDE2877347.1 hypothetical protein [Candidatus Palauibacter soopunensis]
MNETSSPGDLTSRLRSRLEADRRRIEDEAARELARLGENLSAIASGALRSIEADTVEATGRMRELLMKAWLRPLVVGMSLFLGICFGSLGTMHWLSRSIHDRIETLDELDTRTGWARAMLAEIEETTWGVELLESSGDRYVSLPAGTTVRPAFTMDGRPYLKLSRE